MDGFPGSLNDTASGSQRRASHGIYPHLPRAADRQVDLIAGDATSGLIRPTIS